MASGLLRVEPRSLIPARNSTIGTSLTSLRTTSRQWEGPLANLRRSAGTTSTCVWSRSCPWSSWRGLRPSSTGGNE
eukprot:4246050-Pyramimonas_sp.AAC.1